MRPTLFQIAVVLAGIASVDSASVSQSATLKLPFRKSASHSRLARRANGLAVAELDMPGIAYVTTVKLGSQGTEIDFVVDSGSSDTWVPSDVFDPTTSTSFTNLTQDFSTQYGEGLTVTGYFGTDTLTIGKTCHCRSLTVDNFQFAVTPESTDMGQYVLGVGLPSNEAMASRDVNTGEVTNTYDNLPAALKSQGLIQSNLYSIWLDDVEAAKGELVFGGIDNAKYEGTIQTMPFITQQELTVPEYHLFRPNSPDRFLVVLNGISFENGNGTSADVVAGASLPVNLDTGATLCYLPPDIVAALAASLGATEVSSYYVVDSIPSGYIVFTLAGVPIKVPLSSFIRQLNIGDGSAYVLGITNGNELGGDEPQIDNGTLYILGDSFLNGAYCVFDLDNLEFGVAQAKFGVTEENIEVVNGRVGTPAPGYSSTSTNTVYQLSTPTGLF